MREVKPTIDGERGHATRNQYRLIVAIAIALAAIASISIWEGIFQSARSGCQSAASSLKKTSLSYDRLITSDDTVDALGIKDSEVKNPATIDALKEAAKSHEVPPIDCKAKSPSSMNAMAAKANHMEKSIKNDAAALKKAIKNVKKSQRARTVDEANQLLEDSRYKVDDDKTRDLLDIEIDCGSEQDIRDAMAKVRESLAVLRKKGDKVQAEWDAMSGSLDSRVKAMHDKGYDFTLVSSDGTNYDILGQHSYEEKKIPDMPVTWDGYERDHFLGNLDVIVLKTTLKYSEISDLFDQANSVQSYSPSGNNSQGTTGKSYYRNCKDVWKTLGHGITSNDPGYRPELDADSDGYACEIQPNY